MFRGFDRASMDKQDRYVDGLWDWGRLTLLAGIPMVNVSVISSVESVRIDFTDTMSSFQYRASVTSPAMLRHARLFEFPAR